MLSHADFLINGGKLKNVENFEYLGLPIGDRKFVEEYFEKKFRIVEKTFFQLRNIGLHKKLIDANLLGFIYSQFCQSTFLYGLELITLKKSFLKSLETRQCLLLKMALGLPKFSKNTPLLEALNIRSLQELYFKFKFLFSEQIKKHWVALELFKQLNSSTKYKTSKESFLSQLKELKSISSTLTPGIPKQDGLKLIRNRFRCDNEGLVDSIRMTLRDPDRRDLLRLLLWVDFGRTHEVQSPLLPDSLSVDLDVEPGDS